jgi:hypothetical protein
LHKVKQSLTTRLGEIEVLDNYPEVSKGLKVSIGNKILNFEEAVDTVRTSTALVVVY